MVHNRIAEGDGANDGVTPASTCGRGIAAAPVGLATVATVLQTAKPNDVDLHPWLTQTLERIAQGWPISNIDQLMPWNFKA